MLILVNSNMCLALVKAKFDIWSKQIKAYYKAIAIICNSNMYLVPVKAKFW